eukprot:TRINITY_DN844_c0_g1_i1.p1 TRINITY_DN844_c0_g1~~TRINITY_DN844_c0_g1_i1.p1  ORF type:complete len:106 (-),score=9.65 TRINITY_DN844_c0_g1_i1:238-555(-)
MATPYKMNTQQQQHVMQQPQEVHQLGPKDERHFSVHLYVPQGDHVPDKYCRRCGRQDTWQWRRGPDGCSSLCNACGQRYAKMVERENRNCVPYPRQRISVGELIW